MLDKYLAHLQERVDLNKPPRSMSVRMKSIGVTTIDTRNPNKANKQIQDLHDKLEFTGGGFEGHGWKRGTNLYAYMDGDQYHMSIDDPKGELRFKGKLVTVIKGWDKVDSIMKKYIGKKRTLEMYPPGSAKPEITWLYVEG